MHPEPSLPARVTVVEVGPRDGLQNEAHPVPASDKIEFIRRLAEAGLRQIEATSFVSPKRIPQLADAEQVAAALPAATGALYSALVPNMQGLARALNAGLRRVAVFTAASETFTHKNIGMSIEESLRTFGEVITETRRQGVSVRAYVSTAWICPYEGDVRPECVRDLARRLLDLGADEISLGDTIGAAAPREVLRLLAVVRHAVSLDRIALHFHDTYGTAAANVYAGLTAGVTVFDSSAGGLGGCPYAPGASGNLATEDLLYLLHRMGVETGVSLERVAAASLALERVLGRPLPSRQLARLRSQTPQTPAS